MHEPHPLWSVIGVVLFFCLLPRIGNAQMSDDPAVAHFEFSQINKLRDSKGEAYHEFLRTPSMNCGIYHLAAGTKDGQSPHPEDELYYIESGVSKFFADGEQFDVGPGSLIYVRAYKEHYFHSIKEDLTVLVFFSTHERVKPVH